MHTVHILATAFGQVLYDLTLQMTSVSHRTSTEVSSHLHGFSHLVREIKFKMFLFYYTHHFTKWYNLYPKYSCRQACLGNTNSLDTDQITPLLFLKVCFVRICTVCHSASTFPTDSHVVKRSFAYFISLARCYDV